MKIVKLLPIIDLSATKITLSLVTLAVSPAPLNAVTFTASSIRGSHDGKDTAI